MKKTFEDVQKLAGNQLFAVMSTSAMGSAEFFRKGLGGQQASQTESTLRAVKDGKQPDFTGTIAEKRFNDLKSNQKKAVAATILCGRVPSMKKDGVGISGPTVDAENLKTEVREQWQQLRAQLAEFYNIEELRKLYPRSHNGERRMKADSITEGPPDTEEPQEDVQNAESM